MAGLVDILAERLGFVRYAVDPGPELRGPELAYADPQNLFRGNVFEPYNPSALVTKRGLKIYDLIRTDDQVKAALAFKKLAVLATGWEIQSPEGKGSSWKPAEDLYDQLSTIDGKLEQSLMGVLTALDYGYSVTEKLYEFEDGVVRLKALKSKSPHGIRFRMDKFGNLDDEGIVQDQGGGPKAMPTKKFIVFQHQSEFGNPYGRSDLEAAYRSWWVKDNGYKWMAMLMERYGVPPIFGLYNARRYTKTQIDRLKDVLRNLQAATSGTIPRTDKDDLELWSPELAGQVSRIFVPALQMMNQDIARAILMPGQLGITPDAATGSLARARKIFDVFMLVVEYLRSCVEELVMQEQLVHQWTLINYAEDAFPMFKFMPLTDEDRAGLFETWVKLLTAGAVKTGPNDEAHFRQTLELPEREVDDSEFEDDEPDDGGDPEDEPDTSDDGGDDPELDEILRSLQAADGVGRVPDANRIDREPNDREERHKVARLAAVIDGAEERGIEALAKEIDRILAVYLKFVRGGPTAASVAGLKPVGKKQLAAAINRVLRDAFDKGRTSLREELPRAAEQVFEPVSFLPSAALSFLRSKALVIAGVVSDRLVAGAREAMLMGLKTGEPTQRTMARLRKVFEPYAGRKGLIRDGKVVTPNRLETIVRTNLTDAFNQGRLVEAKTDEARKVVQGMQYSAILDERTTEVCQFLDGKIFELDSEELERLSPPNHFNCRSILVEVLIGEDVDEGDLITDGEIGQALELAQDGFK